MIVGALLRKYSIFSKNRNKRKKNFLIVFFIYILTAYINPNVNLSIREYGPYGLLSVILVIILGISGSITCIKVSDFLRGTELGKMIAYIGQLTIPLLAFHIFIFVVLDEILVRRLHIVEKVGFMQWIYGITEIVIVIICVIFYTKAIKFIKGKLSMKLFKNEVSK